MLHTLPFSRAEELQRVKETGQEQLRSGDGCIRTQFCLALFSMIFPSFLVAEDKVRTDVKKLSPMLS